MAQFDTLRSSAGISAGAIDQGLRAHMNKVYGTMSIGMLITGAAAWALAGLSVTAEPTQYMIGTGRYLTDFGYALFASPLKWIVMIAPIAMVFLFGAVVNRLSAAAAQVYFFAYAALMGASLSSIFLVFTGMSIVQVFLVTAIAFASLSIYGYTTKRNLSGLGSFLIMGLVGILVASIVNIFLGSGIVALAISVLGVLIFAGLTAFDTQNIKNTYLEFAMNGDQEWLGKAAIMGALSLYLDFINMFMMLLQLFGNRQE